MAFGPYYFRRAAATTDPIMRLKLVVTGAVRGFVKLNGTIKWTPLNSLIVPLNRQH